MNFTDFTDDLAKEFNLSKRTSKKMLTFLQKRIKHKIIFGVEISFREVGTFKLRVRQPKKFLNFQTNKIELSQKSFYLDFKPTEKMINRLKEKTVS